MQISRCPGTGFVGFCNSLGMSLFVGLSEDLFRKKSKISSSEFTPFVRTLIADISKISPATKVYIFGSVARDEASTDSDLDVLFVIPDQENLKDVREQFYKAKTLLDINIDIIFKSEQQFKKMDFLFLDGIRDDLKEVYPDFEAAKPCQPLLN